MIFAAMRRSCPGFRTSKTTKENIIHPQSSGNSDAASISGVKTETVFNGKTAHFVQMHERNAICRIASNAGVDKRRDPSRPQL
jgi:hypothetical protein